MDAVYPQREEKLSNNWILDSGSAPCHISCTMQQVLENNQIPTIPQPPYSPVHATYSCSQDLRLDSCYHFASVEDNQQNITTSLTAVPIYNICRRQSTECNYKPHSCTNIHLQKMINRTSLQSHSCTNIKLSEILPALTAPLEQLCICVQAVL
jgi:hypothetical protein